MQNEKSTYHAQRKECDFIFGSPPGWIIIVQIHSLLCSMQVLYLRHNNSTMQSKVTINMRRRLSVFVCNSSFSQTWHCRIASFRVQKGIGSIISQRHFDRARDSTAAAAAITAYIFVKMDLIRAMHIGNDNRFCLKSSLKRYFTY